MPLHFSLCDLDEPGELLREKAVNLLCGCVTVQSFGDFGSRQHAASVTKGG
jgi:hypothetical protein